MQGGMRIYSYAHTHVGRRSNNEDAHLRDDGLGLYLVADGMGGYEGGEVASQLTADTIRSYIGRLNGPAHSMHLQQAILRANAAVITKRVGRLAQMGSTVAALAICDDAVVLGHLGDSRIYRMRDGRLEALTTDHSLLAELEAAGANIESAAGFRHVVTRAIGMDQAQPELRREKLRPGDLYVLCTDGLSDRVSDDTIAFLLQTRAPGDACKTMVELAYDLGGTDNITAVVLHVVHPARDVAQDRVHVQS